MLTFAAQIETATSLTPIFIDERLSSFEAEQQLIAELTSQLLAANGFKPVSQVIPDEPAVSEAVAADPSSASPGATASSEPDDDRDGTGDGPAAASAATPDEPPATAL